MIIAEPCHNIQFEINQGVRMFADLFYYRHSAFSQYVRRLVLLQTFYNKQDARRLVLLQTVYNKSK